VIGARGVPNEVYFVMKGGVSVKYNKTSFVEFREKSIFGDHSVFKNKPSNFTYTSLVGSTDENISVFMCIHKKKLKELCDLYPDCAQNLRLLAKEKNQRLIKYNHEFFANKSPRESIPNIEEDFSSSSESDPSQENCKLNQINKTSELVDNLQQALQ
jgi:signal-transduction protein with cAMP-binding, CBS, and nucleotidyltransferase domain